MSNPNRPRATKEAKRLASDMSRIGQILSGRYELLELLGQGGMGSVYKARHQMMERIVAIKMLLPDLVEDPEMHDRFLREAKSSGKILHPNVIELLDFGEGADGEAYIVMEFLAGKSLDDILRAEGALEPKRAALIFQQICDGVSAAHAKGLIHRDLKPSNIMLVEQEGISDFVKVVDFGLAKACDPSEESQKLTRTGEVFGSPIYMSPEQCMGQRLDPRSDIYALGVLMYECLTGQVPFLGSTLAETIARHLQDIPRPFAEIRPDLQDIPAALEAVVMRSLAKERDDRQESLYALREEIIDAMLPKLQAKKKTTTTALRNSASLSSSSRADFDSVANAEHTVRQVAANQNQVIGTRSPRGASETASGGGAGSGSGSGSNKTILIALVAGLFVLAGAVAAFACFAFMSKPNSAQVILPSPAVLNPRSSNQVMPGENKVPVPQGQKQLLPKTSNLHEASSSKQDPGMRSPSSPKVSSTSVEPTSVSAKESTRASSRVSSQVSSNVSLEEKQALKAQKLAKKLEARLASKQSIRKKLAKTPHETVVHVSEAAKELSPGPSSSAAGASLNKRKRHRDWHDFSYGFEKKDSYSSSWSVPVAGSKRSD